MNPGILPPNISAAKQEIAEITARLAQIDVLAKGDPGPEGPTGPSGSGPAFGNPGAIFYVLDSTGNDSNDGKTWNSACKTILGALDKGMAISKAVAPTLVIELGPVAHVGGEVANQGLWLCGNMDPAQPPATPPAGWRYVDRPLLIRGCRTGQGMSFTAPGSQMLPGTTGVWGTAYAGGPAIQIAGNTIGTTFEWVDAYQSGATPAVVVGIGTDGIDRMTSFNSFRHCGFAVRGQPADASDTGSGPVMRFGNSFWNRIEDTTLLANGSAPIASDRRAAILLKPVNPAAGAVYLTFGERLTFQHGGVIHYTGNTPSDSTWRDLFMEGAGLSYSLPPVVRGSGATSGGLRIAVQDAYSGDAYWAPPDYRVDAQLDAGVPAASMLAVNVPYVKGLVTVISADPVNYATLNAGTTQKSAAQQGWAGFASGRFYGQHDGGRRLMLPAVARYPNLAGDLPSFAATKAPDGSTRGRVVPFGSVGTYATLGNHTFSPGDHFVFGAWVRNATGVGLPRIQFYSGSAGTHTFIAGGASTNGKCLAVGDWNALSPCDLAPSAVWGSTEDATKFTWVGGWARVVTGTSPDHFDLHFEDFGGSALQVDGVNFHYIPVADGWSDDEIASWAADQGSTPSKQVGSTVYPAPVGEFSLFPGQRIGMWDATLGAWRCLKIDNGALVVEAP